MDFIYLGCDGIFENLESHEVITEIWNELRKAKDKDQTLHSLTGDCVDHIMRCSVASRSLDNITSLILNFKNLKKASLVRKSQSDEEIISILTEIPLDYENKDLTIDDINHQGVSLKLAEL